MTTPLKEAYDYGCRLALQDFEKSAGADARAFEFLTDALGAGLAGGATGGVAGLLNSEDGNRLRGFLSGAAGGATLGSLARLGQRASMGADLASKMDDLTTVTNLKNLPRGNLETMTSAYADVELAPLLAKRKAHLQDLRGALDDADRATSNYHLGEIALNNSHKNRVVLKPLSDKHLYLMDETNKVNRGLASTIDNTLADADIDNILRDPDFYKNRIGLPTIEYVRTRPGIDSEALRNRLADPESLLADSASIKELVDLKPSGYISRLAAPKREALSQSLEANPLRGALAGYLPALGGVLGGYGASEVSDRY